MSFEDDDDDSVDDTNLTQFYTSTFKTCIKLAKERHYTSDPQNDSISVRNLSVRVSKDNLR